MAASISPAPSFRPVPVGGHSPRPALRALPGGRSAVAMAPAYRRRRALGAVVLLIVLVAGWQVLAAAAGVAGGWAAPHPAPLEGPTVVVEADAGDTLWTLAREVRPRGDVRPAVEAMLAARGTTALEVGDRVHVPVG